MTERDNFILCAVRTRCDPGKSGGALMEATLCEVINAARVDDGLPGMAAPTIIERL